MSKQNHFLEGFPQVSMVRFADSITVFQIDSLMALLVVVPLRLEIGRNCEFMSA